MPNDNSVRIILNLGKEYGVTDEFCAKCPYAQDGVCVLSGDELDWNKKTLQFIRTDYCRFLTLRNRGVT